MRTTPSNGKSSNIGTQVAQAASEDDEYAPRFEFPDVLPESADLPDHPRTVRRVHGEHYERNKAMRERVKARVETRRTAPNDKLMEGCAKGGIVPVGGWVIETGLYATLTLVECKTLAVLKHHGADKERGAFPSAGLIAARIGSTPTRVGQALRSLVDKGIVRCLPGRQRRSHIYRTVSWAEKQAMEGTR